MIQVKILQANNDIGLESLINHELLALNEKGCVLIGVQFQHTAVIMGEGARPSYAAMITYDEETDKIEYEREEYELDVPIQRD